MYKPKEAEKFVENLVTNKIHEDFIIQLFNNSNDFIFSNLSNIKINSDQGVYDTTNLNSYFGIYGNQKILQDFIDLYMRKKGSTVFFSNSIFCSNKYNNSLNGDFLIFPGKKTKFLHGSFLYDFYKLINDIYEVELSDFITLSDKNIEDKDDLKIFADVFVKNVKNFSKTIIDKHLKDEDIHYFFNKFDKETKNNIILYFIENFPYILYKYFVPKEDIENIKNSLSHNPRDLLDFVDTPYSNVLLSGNFVYLKYDIYQEEKFYIRILLESKGYHF